MHLAEHFGGAGLVVADLGVDEAHGFEQVQRADASDVGGGGGLLEADTDKALRSQVVDFSRLDFLHQRNSGAQVSEIVFNQMQVGVVHDAQLLHAPEVDRAGTAISAMDGVAFVKQQLGQVGAVLSGHAGDQGSFLHKWTF